MASSFIFFLFVFWLVRNIKYILFWIYLWQTKQYHKGRLIDHLKTETGKKILYSKSHILKFILFIIFCLAAIFFSEGAKAGLLLLLFLAYFMECLSYFRSFSAKVAVNPVFTKKTTFLAGASGFLAIFYYILISVFFPSNFAAGFLLLVFDILLPVIVSLIVVGAQPIARNYQISKEKQAKEKISNFKIQNSKFKIIAITGSYGKTGTKEYLATILSSKFNVLFTKENQNAEIGIAETILDKLKPEHNIFVVEIGAYDKGKIKEVCDFLQPDIGIVTGVNTQHLALFGLMENLLSAEGGQELLGSLPDNGLLIVNGENKHCMDLYNQARIRKISYSYKDAEGIIVQKDFVSFKFQGEHFRVNGYGKHSILHSLAAVMCAKDLGMTVKEISEAAKIISHKQSPFKIIKKDGRVIIDATYSSNPDGVFADLEYLELYSADKKIIVMPCLIELGEAAKEAHKQIAGKIAEVCDLAIITTPDFFEEMKAEAILAGMDEKNILNIADGQEILERINTLGENSTILLEGRLSEEIMKKIL